MVHPEPNGTDPPVAADLRAVSDVPAADRDLDASDDLAAADLDPDDLADELDELTALRDANRATGDPAARATRSATAYLDARRRRLKRELREAT